MNEELKELFEGVIKAQIQDLTLLEPGSKEKSEAIDDLVQLYKLKIDETKIQMDFEEKREQREMEEDHFESERSLKESQAGDDSISQERDQRLREAQLEEQRRDRYFRVGIEAAGIVVPIVFYAVWMKKGFKFEETGTFTSQTFRGLFNRFRPTK